MQRDRGGKSIGWPADRARAELGDRLLWASTCLQIWDDQTPNNNNNFDMNVKLAALPRPASWI